MPRYLACYVRLDYDRRALEGRRLTLRNADLGSPVHLCGAPAETFEAAEELARQTVRHTPETHRGNVLPRVFEFYPGDNLIDAGDRAEEWFLEKVAEMNEADLIASRSEALS